MKYVAVVFCTDCNLLTSAQLANDDQACPATDQAQCFDHGREESPAFSTSGEAEEWAEVRTQEFKLWDYDIEERAA